MSRSGYSEDYEYMGLYRSNVERASRGKRGQAFFRELLAALDAMPLKRLTSGVLEAEGDVCALGALRRAKGVALEPLEQSDWDELGKAFNVAPMLTQEVMYENDQDHSYRRDATPEERWTRMREWVAAQLIDAGKSAHSR
jgi:hypothetical protein